MRVTGGRLGGRTLRAPKGDATRPTTDRVRESLFQILGDLAGLRAADLYAGTGALGIEALSRGASFAAFVEARRPAALVLRSNLDALELGAVSTVIVAPVERALESLRALGPFDLDLGRSPVGGNGAGHADLATLGVAPPRGRRPPGGRACIARSSAHPPGLSPRALRRARMG